MSAEMFNETVEWGDFAIRSEKRVAGPGGYIFELIEVIGWDDPPPDDTETIKANIGDGDIPLRAGFGARSIEVKGRIWAREDPEYTMHEAVQRLRRPRAGTLVVDQHSQGKRLESTVRRVNLRFGSRMVPTSRTFSLFFVADDPLRYSTEERPLVAGANAFTNPGDARTWPSARFVGPHPGPRVEWDQGVWQLQAVAAGQTIDVDWRHGDVWDGNSRLAGLGVQSGPMPSIPSFGRTLQVSGLGSGSATVRRFEAWT